LPFVAKKGSDATMVLRGQFCSLYDAIRLPAFRFCHLHFETLVSEEGWREAYNEDSDGHVWAHVLDVG